MEIEIKEIRDEKPESVIVLKILGSSRGIDHILGQIALGNITEEAYKYVIIEDIREYKQEEFERECEQEYEHDIEDRIQGAFSEGKIDKQLYYELLGMEE